MLESANCSLLLGWPRCVHSEDGGLAQCQAAGLCKNQDFPCHLLQSLAPWGSDPDLHKACPCVCLPRFLCACSVPREVSLCWNGELMSDVQEGQGGLGRDTSRGRIPGLACGSRVLPLGLKQLPRDPYWVRDTVSSWQQVSMGPWSQPRERPGSS